MKSNSYKVSPLRTGVINKNMLQFLLGGSSFTPILEDILKIELAG